MTRQAKIQPKTAYDYRHSIELVQTLSTSKDSNIIALCEAWGLPTKYTDFRYAIQTLAEEAIKRDYASK